MVQFKHQKEMGRLKLKCTLAILAIICQLKSTNVKFHPLCLRLKLLWMEPLSGIHQRSANQSLEMMGASISHIQYVNICQQNCTQDGSLIPICKNSKLDSQSRVFENMVTSKNQTGMQN